MKKGLKRLVLLAILLILAIAVTPGIAGACLYDKCFNSEYGAIYHDSLTLNLEVHGFAFSAMAGDVIIIRANHPDNTFDISLKLLNPQGFQIASAGIPGTGQAEIVTGKINLEGTYTIIVSDIIGNGKGQYHLSLESINNPSNPQFMFYGGLVRDTIKQLSGLKIYQFTGVAEDVINIQMIAISGGIDPYIRLYRPDGRLLDANADGSYAILPGVVLPDSGVYTIIASDEKGDEPGEYFLILNDVITDVDNESPAGLPLPFALHQNHPNPFNPQTTIEFNLPRSSEVSIEVYNVVGENIITLVSGRIPAGSHSVIWDSRDDNGEEVPSGIYFYRLRTDEFSQTRKMLLLR
jgi:hypothetical protein